MRREEQIDIIDVSLSSEPSTFLPVIEDCDLSCVLRAFLPKKQTFLKEYYVNFITIDREYGV